MAYDRELTHLPPVVPSETGKLKSRSGKFSDAAMSGRTNWEM
jgi:hypothetical protein